MLESNDAVVYALVDNNYHASALVDNNCPCRQLLSALDNNALVDNNYHACIMHHASVVTAVVMKAVDVTTEVRSMETRRVEAMTLITHLIVKYVWVVLNRFVDDSNNHSKVIA